MRVEVYDVAKRESFENISSWLAEIEIYATKPNLAKLLIGNKVDLVRFALFLH
jgi:Ras-related protein Rab-18